MKALQRCLRMLDRFRIGHVHTRHANAYTALEVAKAEHLPPYMFAKTVVLRSCQGYCIAVLPADCTVDLAELGSVLNVDLIRLATEEEIRQRFPDSEIGCAPPFGFLYGLPVYLDVRLAEEAFICLNAGTHRDAIRMSVEDFIRVADPVIIRFATPEHMAVTAY